MELTQSELKRLLNYDPSTGVFTWKVSTTRSVKVGDTAGGYNDNRYVLIGVNKKIYRAHRLAWLYMNGEWPSGDIDHINHIRDDNRIENLRVVSRQGNLKNLSRRKNNKSGIHGVCWDKSQGKWKSQLKFNGKNTYLGQFNCKATAGYVVKHFMAKAGFHENHGK